MTGACSLLARAGTGDRDAFAALYDETCGTAHRLALALAGDPERAAELLVRGYLEAWRTASCFDPATSRALPWLLATVQGQAVR